MTMNFLLKKIIPISIALVSLLLPACEEDDFLDGYNRNELFAKPTQSELDAVVLKWQSRDLSLRDYKVIQEVNIAESNLTLKIVTFSVSGHIEYGALVMPEGNSRLPVRMYAGGFALDNAVNSIKLIMSGNANADRFMFAFPALRGQSLSITINDGEYTSPVSTGKHCDAFDGAADDVIAFLNLIEVTELRADVQRTTVRGGSRGATVALLVAERDKRVKGAIAVAGPVNLLKLTSQSENDRTYQCQFLSDLVQGKSSMQSARSKMIASSPLYFAQYLPKTQLHLGKNDRIVPVSQGEDLKMAMTNLGMKDSLELFIYDRTHENIATDNQELNDRINEFLKQF
jgi:pimeloyl-ACP methyl ester carboxylesterase